MTAPLPSAGSAGALTRRLSTTIDWLDLYSALTDGGRRPDTMLIETLAGASMILDRAAVRIECRGQEVTLFQLTTSGEEVLRLAERTLSHNVAERSPDRLRLRFDRTESDDAEQRLLASSPFDVLRALTTGMRSTSQ